MSCKLVWAEGYGDGVLEYAGCSYDGLMHHKYGKNIIYVFLHWELGKSNIFEILVKRIS